MKKVFVILLCLLFVLDIFFVIKSNFNQTIYCDDELSKSEIEEIISDSIASQLNNLNFEQFEQILDDLGQNEKDIFDSSTFLDKVKKVISGEFSQNQKSLWTSVVNLFFDDVLAFLPILCLVVAISVTFSLVSASRPNSKNKSLGDVIHFVCFGTIIIVLVSYCVNMITLTSNTIQSIKSQMDISLPVLLTVLTAIGGTASVGVYQPAVAVLGGAIINIFTNILMPIFIFRLVFSVISNISTNIKLGKFADFFSSSFKWIIGIVFTVFSAFLAVQGITAASVDGISFRTAKYTIKNTIPLLGGYVSDGLNLIVASSVLIKNAVGLCGLLLLFATIVVPIIKLVVFMFGLKLAAALLEPISDSRITNFMSMMAGSVSLLIVLIVGCAFMYVLLSGMIMLSANLI